MDYYVTVCQNPIVTFVDAHHLKANNHRSPPAGASPPEDCPSALHIITFTGFGIQMEGGVCPSSSRSWMHIISKQTATEDCPSVLTEPKKDCSRSHSPSRGKEFATWNEQPTQHHHRGTTPDDGIIISYGKARSRN